jgi:putative FmdB family regulatory protein
MPIYEYECMNCGKQCEVIQKFNDEPLSTCPECGGHMHKLVSQTSFILKGTGWYATDYASSTRKKAMEAEGTSSPVSEKKSGAKKEAKSKTAVKK